MDPDINYRRLLMQKGYGNNFFCASSEVIYMDEDTMMDTGTVQTTTMAVWAWGLMLVHAPHRGYHPRDLPNLAALHGSVN